MIYNKKTKDQKEPSFGVVNYATENIGKEVFYSEEEKKLLHRSLVDDSKKYLNSELAYKLKKKDKALYKVLYAKIPGNIQNHDFYIAFRNVKLNELVNPQDEKEDDEENSGIMIRTHIGNTTYVRPFSAFTPHQSAALTVSPQWEAFW